MRLDIAFEYDVQYVPARHRNPKTAHSLASVSVEIAHAEPGSVRLMHTIASTYEHDGDAGPYAQIRTPGKAPSACRIIEHDGRAYVESCPADDLDRLTSDRSEKAHGSPFHVHPKAGGYNHMMTVGDYSGPVRKPVDVDALVKEAGGFRPGTYRDDGGKAVADLILARASELLIYDGSVFIPTAEPVLALSRVPPLNGGEAHTLVLGIAESRQAGWSSFEKARSFRGHHLREEVFALDRKPDAVDYARRLAEMAQENFVDGALIDLVTPADLRFSGSWPIHRVANGMLWEMGAKVMLMEPSVAEAYAELRDACADLPGLCSVRQVAALDAFLVEVSAHGLPGIPLAKECAQAAIMGARDVELEARCAADSINLVQLVQACAALGESERLGKSWVRVSPMQVAPVEGCGMGAVEVLSTFEAARLADTLGGSLDVDSIPDEGRCVALLDATQVRARPHGLACLTSAGTVEWSMGRDGRPLSPHAMELVATFAAEVGVEFGMDMDSRDVDAFAL